jgi:diguanylate cyclase
MGRSLRQLNVPDAACPDFIAYLDIRRAILRHDFFLEYQPKVSLGSGLIEGVEALVRWNHRKLGRLPPDVFIPRLERTQLIHSLTWSVLDEAVARCATLHDQGFLLGVAVNVSPAAVTELLPRRVDAVLRRYRLDPSWLTLEMTQSLPFENLSRAHSILNAIHARGVHISLDDFGMGYASLAQLQTLPFDEIKIDRVFVGRATRSKRDEEIVRFVAALGCAMGLRVVAEGIENRRTMKLMHSLGVHVAQGDYLAPALSVGDLLAEFPLVSERARSRMGRFALDLTDAKAPEATLPTEDPTWARR